jgi:SSS family solute:Na+ symporter
MHQSLAHIDGIMIFVYFSAVLAIGLSSSWKQDGDSTMYFLSGRGMGWFSIGTSLIAADILCGHLVGLSGIFGRALAIDMELMGIVGLVLLGWWVGPKFLKNKSITVTDFLTRRYSESAGTYVSAFYIIIYLLTRLSLVLFMGAFLIQLFSHSDESVTIMAIILIAGLYSIVGGFSAVVRTQSFQAVVMLFGLAAFFLGTAGTAATKSVSSIISDPVIGASVNLDAGIPWIALMVGIPLMAFWLWLTDQYMMQHVFGARSRKDLKKGTILTAIVKGLIFVPILIWVSTSPVEIMTSPSTIQLPPLYRGVVLISIFSAMMASLAGLYNSVSALFTMDMYKRKHPSASERQLVLVGRLSTTAAVLVAALWMPLMAIVDWQRSSSLQSLLAFFAATVMGVFLSGVVWKRTTALGAASALVFGTFLGCLRILGGYLVNSEVIDNQFLIWLLHTNYLNFAALIFVFSVLTLIGVSLVVPSHGSNIVAPYAQRNP